MEKKLIQKQLLKSLFLTFVTFTFLLVSFDIFIYHVVKKSIFEYVDKELVHSKEDFNRPKMFDKENLVLKEKDVNKGPSFEMDKNQNNDFKFEILNPRIIMIERTLDGDITNIDEIGAFYAAYESELSFDSTDIDNIYNLDVGKFSYRGLNFKINDGYVQLLINIDSEQNSINNVVKTLVIGSFLILIISLGASYLLSKRTLKPIIESYRKETEFVQNASHELRTPLTIIKAKQELLLQEPNSRIIDKSEDINVSLQETRRLTKLIKELMILAKSDSNKYELNKEDIIIDNLIKDLLTPYMELYSDRCIRLDLEYGKKCNLDKDKISELLIILLDNAIKYTKENDEITVKTFEENKKLVIEVIDTGIGINDDAIDKVFDRFYREDKSHSRKILGNGLGLSIASVIVNSHKGTIKVSHNKPKGTIFTIKI